MEPNLKFNTGQVESLRYYFSNRFCILWTWDKVSKEPWNLDLKISSTWLMEPDKNVNVLKKDNWISNLYSSCIDCGFQSKNILSLLAHFEENKNLVSKTSLRNLDLGSRKSVQDDLWNLTKKPMTDKFNRHAISSRLIKLRYLSASALVLLFIGRYYRVPFHIYQTFRGNYPFQDGNQDMYRILKGFWFMIRCVWVQITQKTKPKNFYSGKFVSDVSESKQLKDKTRKVLFQKNVIPSLANSYHIRNTI